MCLQGKNLQRDKTLRGLAYKMNPLEKIVAI